MSPVSGSYNLGVDLSDCYSVLVNSTASTSHDAYRDAALVQSALENPDAFVHIVERFQEPLRRYLMRLGCHDSEDVRDVLQDVFCKIYVNLNEYDERLALSSWVYRIAHNEAISFFRKMNVRPRAVETEEELQLFETLVDAANPEEQSEARRGARMIRAALSGMDSEYRDVLILRYLEDKSYDEISDILKIPLGTVGTRVSRGKKQLKDALSPRNIRV